MNFVCIEATLSDTTIYTHTHTQYTAAGHTHEHFYFFRSKISPFLKKSFNGGIGSVLSLSLLNELLLTLCIHNQSRPQNLLELEKKNEHTHTLTHAPGGSCYHYYHLVIII